MLAMYMQGIQYVCYLSYANTRTECEEKRVKSDQMMCQTAAS